MKNYLKLAVAIVILAVLVYLLFVFDIPRAKAPDTVDDITFTTSSSTLELVRVESPTPGTNVSSPLSISGTARGNWYFEASFPIKIIGADGKEVLGMGIGQAKGDWMTTDFVPFTALINFAPRGNKSGFIRLMKDNPSGIESLDAHIDIPVKF